MMSDNSREAHVKLIDFGLAARCKTDTLTHACGTLHYLAPEVLRGEYGKAADVWTLGVVLFLSMYADYPFDGESATSVMQSILTAQPEWSDSCYALSPESLALLKKTLHKEKHLRLTATAALQHSWFGARSRYSVPSVNAAEDAKLKKKHSARGGPRHSAMVDEQLMRRLSMMSSLTAEGSHSNSSYLAPVSDDLPPRQVSGGSNGNSPEGSNKKGSAVFKPPQAGAANNERLGSLLLPPSGTAAFLPCVPIMQPVE